MRQDGGHRRAGIHRRDQLFVGEPVEELTQGPQLGFDLRVRAIPWTSAWSSFLHPRWHATDITNRRSIPLGDGVASLRSNSVADLSPARA